jgi:SOS-response transcriptional repressor LexA
MDSKQLTLKQLEFLNYIKDYKSDKGVFPTYIVIQEAFGFRSPHSVTQNIKALIKKGYLTKKEGAYKLTKKRI